MVDVCSAGFSDFIYSGVMPAAAVSAIAATAVIAASYMYGKATSNPKLNDYSKTEAVQLPITIASIIFIVLVISSFCSIDMNSVRAVFNLPVLPNSTDVFGAAESYLDNSAIFAQQALVTARYQHSAYNILLMRSTYACEWWCIFGQSGFSYQGFSGYTGRMNLMGMLMNTSLISLFSALNALFILNFVKSGFFMMLLPIGIFTRSMPYLRAFGSIFIAIAMSFFLIYPATLAVFSMMDKLFTSPLDGLTCQSGDNTIVIKDYLQNDENIISRDDSDPGLNIGEKLHDDELARAYLPCGQDYPAQTAQLAAYAFIAAAFLPTVALLAAAASARYIAKMFGEEVDLSRVAQMV